MLLFLKDGNNRQYRHEKKTSTLFKSIVIALLANFQQFSIAILR